MVKDSLDHKINKENIIINRQQIAYVLNIQNNLIFARSIEQKGKFWVPFELLISESKDWVIVRKDRLKASQYEALIYNRTVEINSRPQYKVDHNFEFILFNENEEIRLKPLKEKIKQLLKEEKLGPHGVGLLKEEICLHEKLKNFLFFDISSAIHRCVNIYDNCEFIRINKPNRIELRICLKELEQEAIANIPKYLQNPINEEKYLLESNHTKARALEIQKQYNLHK